MRLVQSSRLLLQGSAVVLLAGAAWGALAQAAAAPVSVARLADAEAIRLDGTLDHPAWARAREHAEFLEREPVNGARPTHATRVRVLVGARAIYVGVTALDPEPGLIRAPLVRHDTVYRTQDCVTVYIDPVGNGRTAQFFRVSAAGSTADGIWTGDDDNEDFQPDFDFDAASARTSAGWTAVLRIPFAALRYRRESGEPWRIMVTRAVPREQNRLIASVPIPLEAQSFIAHMAPLEGIGPPQDDRFLQVRPTVTARRSTERGPGAFTTQDNSLEFGADLKWRPRPEWVVDATINPDFSQVELDTPQLARNTRFALYFPEKRPFFLESADLLRSPTEALYTRTVTRPRWGLRASLRGESLSGTAFTGRDAGGGTTLLPGAYATGTAAQPASTLGVVRGRTDLGALSVGGLAAMRRYAAGAGENAVAGPDIGWQATDTVRLRGQWLASRTTALPDATGTLADSPAATGSRLHLLAAQRTQVFDNTYVYEDVTGGFRNDSGFVTQAGIRRASANVQRLWRNVGPFNVLAGTFFAETVQDRALSQTVSRQFVPGVRADWSSYTEATLEYRGYTRTRVDAAGPLIDERYWHWQFTTTPAVWVPALTFNLDAGRIADVTARASREGWRALASARLRPHRAIELEPSYTEAALKGETGRVYQETLSRLLAIWHIAPRQSLRLIVQRTNLDRAAEPLLGVAADSDRSHADSLTWTWRQSAGTMLHVGAGRGLAGLGIAETKGTEVFAKIQVDLDELRNR